jgi:ABC-type nitrate/sulfonate/bicarbonate transport system permease component
MVYQAPDLEATRPQVVERPTTAGPSWLAVVLRWLIPVALLAAWQFWASDISSLLIPTPTAILEALWELIQSGELWELLWISNQSLILGTALSLAAGIPFGILLGRSQRVDRFLFIFIQIGLAAPSVAFLPLVIVFLGLDLTARTFFVFLFSFDLVVTMIRNGVRGVDPNLIEMADSFAARRRHLWVKVLLPGMVPTIAAAVRVAITRGLVGMTIIELTLIAVGIGGFITHSRAFFASSMVFAGVLVICVEALLLTFAAQRLEKWLTPRGLYGTG